MKTKILTVLKYTESDYDTLVFDLYIAWCASHSLSDNHCQLLITSNKLYNWFMTEYSKSEKHFLYLAKPYIGKVSLKDLRALYDDKTTKINFYPKAILNDLLQGAKLNAKKQIHLFPLRTEHTLN